MADFEIKSVTQTFFLSTPYFQLYNFELLTLGDQEKLMMLVH